MRNEKWETRSGMATQSRLASSRRATRSQDVGLSSKYKSSVVHYLLYTHSTEYVNKHFYCANILLKKWDKCISITIQEEISKWKLSQHADIKCTLLYTLAWACYGTMPQCVDLTTVCRPVQNKFRAQKHLRDPPCFLWRASSELYNPPFILLLGYFKKGYAACTGMS